MRNYGSWTFLFATMGLVSCGLPNIYLLQDGTNAYCIIANETESTALVLTKNQRPIPASRNSQHPTDTLFCKTSSERKCENELGNDIWKYDISDNYDLAPITDRRWEDFDLIKTGVLKFVNIHNISETEKDFEFTLSKKIGANAFVYLCDGMFPPDSNCYWFIMHDALNAQRLNVNVIQKCKKGMIPKEEVPHSEDHAGIPSNLITWTHFVFTKNANSFVVKRNLDNSAIVRYEDTNSPPFKVSHVVVASLSETPGEWKINDGQTVYRTGGPLSIQQWFNKKITKYSFSVMCYGNKECNLYIYLCENDTHDSSCYKILFNHMKDPEVCISTQDKTDYTLKSIEKQTTNFSSWTHLTLKSDNSTYTLMDNRKIVLLQFHDDKLKPKHVLIGSDGLVFWKIQSYGLFTANNPGYTSLRLKNGFENQEVCIAIFAQSCGNFTLILELVDECGKALDTYTQSNKNIWEEVKLKTTLQKDAKLKLLVALSTANNGRAFIGDIRNCSRNLRIITTTNKKYNKDDKENPSISCQPLKFPDVKSIEEKVLIIPSLRNSTIEVLWLPADDKNTYKLETELIYEGCIGFQNSSKMVHNSGLGLLSTVRLHIIPYTTYSIRLLRNDSVQVFAKILEFNATDVVSEEEMPETMYRQQDEKLYVYLTIKDCTKIKGPLYYYLLLLCSYNWCKPMNPIEVMGKPGPFRVQFPYILGEKNYTISLGVSRTHKTQHVAFKEIHKIYTKPTAPVIVPSVNVFSKTDNSISIKWKEPRPETGVLERYVIEYKHDKQKEWSQYNISNPTKCSIWQEFLCASIGNLTQQINYRIRVKAKNKGVHILSITRGDIREFTKEEAPEPPENVKLTWDDQLNLTVTCTYPSEAVGPIRKLYIEVDETEFSFDLEEGSRSFSKQIDATEFSAKRLSVTAKFSNEGGNSSEAKNTTESPPKTPRILEKCFQKLNNKIYINTDFIQNLEGKSEAFIFQINSSKKYTTTNTNTCDALQRFNSELSPRISLVITNGPNLIDLMDLASNREVYLVVFLRNHYLGKARCTAYSEIPFSQPINLSNSDTSYVTWIIVTLFLLCLSVGIIFYVYKKRHVTYKRGRISLTLSTRKPDTSLKYSYLINKEILGELITNPSTQSELIRQFDVIQGLKNQPQTVGLMPEHVQKNRFEDIVAYDNTRVKLESLYCNIEDCFTPAGYINANYINGYDGTKAYIATQAPTVNTVHDFWRMIWQEDIGCIVMLCRLIEDGKKGCEMYWAEPNETLRYGDLKIKCSRTKTDSALTVRKLTVVMNSEEKKITQIHHEEWPNKGIPETVEELKNLLCLLEDFQQSNKPIVVHSSAGVGRTGTLILCDIAIKTLRTTGIVDIFRILHDLRKQRKNMVETLEQYIYAHKVVIYVTESVYDEVSPIA